MTKVKICGITNIGDALDAINFGADALGFNFYAKSLRHIRPDEAREIVGTIPDGVIKVGVFVNATLENIVDIAGATSLNAIQLHGDESVEFVMRLRDMTGLNIIKAFQVSRGFSVDDVLKYRADAILLDAFSPNERGGTGNAIDLDIAKYICERVPKMYLAGGLSAESVAHAMELARPYAVDACSRLESEPGKKDPEKVRRFIAAVREIA